MGRNGVGGLSVVDGRLWLRHERRFGTRLLFAPNGVVVVRRREHPTFEWERHGEPRSGTSAWTCRGAPASGTRRAVVTITLETRPSSPSTFPLQRTWSVRAPWRPVRFTHDAVPALVAYLAATPDARAGLAATERLTAMLSELAHTVRVAGPLPSPALSGDLLDVDQAVLRAAEGAGVRRFGGRPVRGEWLPQAGALLEAVRAELPARLRDRVEDDVIEREVTRLLWPEPWPFATLVD